CRLSGPRNRIRWGCAGVRADGANDGLRDRAHLRLPPESGGFDRTVGRGPFFSGEAGALYRRASTWGRGSWGGPLRHRQRETWFRPFGWVCVEWLWHALAGRLFAAGRADL